MKNITGDQSYREVNLGVYPKLTFRTRIQFLWGKYRPLALCKDQDDGPGGQIFDFAEAISKIEMLGQVFSMIEIRLEIKMTKGFPILWDFRFLLV